MVTRTVKPVIDTQKESNQIATKHHQITEEDSKRGCKGKKICKTVRKQQNDNHNSLSISNYFKDK